MEWITTTDIHILFGLHRLAGPHMDAFITYFTTVINTLWLWAILAAAGLWKRRSRWVTLTIIVAVILAILVGDVAIKHFVMRIRPYLVIPGAPTLDTLKYPISYSFPSGHSFFFFAGATVLFRSCRRPGIAAYGLACVVAFSRMYLFMHFPSDVLTGAVLGIIIGNIAWQICGYAKKGLSHVIVHRLFLCMQKHHSFMVVLRGRFARTQKRLCRNRLWKSGAGAPKGSPVKGSWPPTAV